MKRLIEHRLREMLLTENSVTPPEIPNTFNFWHGGDLDDFNEVIAQKNGRYEYGPGLYLITHHDTALKYAKGRRKLYLITVEKGIDINNAFLNVNVVTEFIKNFVITNKRNEILKRLQPYIKETQIKAYVFNNIVLNAKAIKPSNTKNLRQFYIENHIDYDIIDNPFGWGEKMMVLYNMKKIVNVITVKPSDKIANYDL